MGLVYTALFIPLLPAMIAVFKWKDLNHYQKWFGMMLWFIVVISFSSRLWTMYTGGNNLPLYYLYILGECLLLLHIFKIMFSNPGNHWWRMAMIGFTIIWMVDICTGKGWWVFPDYIRTLEASIVIVIVVAWFLKMLREKKILQPAKTFEFWMSAGLLIFFSGNFLLFAFPRVMLDAGKEVFEAIWIVHAILNIILYLMYSIALLWIKKIVR